MSDIFEIASRNKLRFPTPIGQVTLEQLWDLPLTTTITGKASLDGTARMVNNELKSYTEESFVETTPNPRKTALTVMLDVLKRIIAVKQEENAATRKRTEKAAERTRILDAIRAKKDQQLSESSLDELQKQLEALDAD